MGFFVLALEEDLEKKRGNFVSVLSFGPETGNVTRSLVKFGGTLEDGRGHYYIDRITSAKSCTME